MDRILENYINGFPYLKLVASAAKGRGIAVPDAEQQDRYIKNYDSFTGTVVKFVPASGAASRMFKDIFAARDAAAAGKKIAPEDAGGKFFAEMEGFPFYTPSMGSMTQLEALDHVLEEPLRYGHLPKGLVHFHKYGTEVRTAFEEHLVEGALYAKGNDGTVRIHFTVSPEHRPFFEKLLSEVRGRYEAAFGVRYDISFSVQDPDTDIMAVNADNTPFLREDGTVLKRPAGHGALLRNLNAMDADVVILKNIDNVVRQNLLDDTVLWKKVLCGKLLELRGRIYDYLTRLEPVLEDSDKSALLCDEITGFLDKEMCVAVPELPQAERASFLFRKLNRPVRVCGMVKNAGEPGGGPFVCLDADGSTSLQILEKAQIDMNDAASVKMLKESTHFNPVDVVCCIKDFRGNVFDLQQFVDPTTGLVSEKSYEGRALKAQELPGLWNGSMSDWNTVFVETPLTTFNPVKTVFDLLRPEHKGE